MIIFTPPVAPRLNSLKRFQYCKYTFLTTRNINSLFKKKKKCVYCKMCAIKNLSCVVL